MSRVTATTPTHLFTETITVQRPTYGTGSAGGKAPSYSNISGLVGIAAAVQPEQGTEFDEFGRQHSGSRAVIFVAGGLDIRSSDRIIFGSRKFDVQGVPKDDQAAGVLIRLDCKELIP